MIAIVRSVGVEINDMTGAIRDVVGREAPDLLDLFDEYVGEMRFGRALIDKNIASLRRGAAILEVGAGSLLLSCRLQQEGFNVTALEPIGSGFSHFSRLQAIVLRHARHEGFAPSLLSSTGEALSICNAFDFAFSINVMEHVADVSTVLQRVFDSLKLGSTYRFVCPNYAFPYEPHFNIPTVISKSLTQKLLWRWIEHSNNVVDPIGTWASLNWISVRSVTRVCRKKLSTTPHFDRSIFDAFLNRAMSDPGFQSRRGTVLVALIALLWRTGFLSLTRLIPATALPIMDCSIVRV
ncbi:class I SAM-dependent methyltransferase [Paraburkholderia sp. BCC1884]|uniref:class I SAM-dependent methyltransferase n=1 Tax=Paraburkholderia sp. BCC1884 TaxID=2562668 RepID=UPI001183E4BC|nr:methyltransferase domain-containing protein [Paraburkholderia sp. BCC1884]